MVIDSSFVHSFLSFNDLREWKSDPGSELQWLNYLDVTGNEHWRPSEQLLKLKRLEKVEGVTWTQYCKNCSLVKIETQDAEANSTPWCYEEYHSPHGWSWYDDIEYGKALEFIKLGFWPTCLCDSPCYDNQINLPYMKAVVYIAEKIAYTLYATCSVGLLVNIAVVLVILCNPALRRDLAVCLVLNISLCDVFVVSACLIYAMYQTDRLYIGYFESIGTEDSAKDVEDGTMALESEIMRLRNIFGPILTFAMASQVPGSFILTFEKFLKIVYSMRPDLRITKRAAQAFIFISLSCCATFAVLPVFEVGGMSYNVRISFMPLPSDFSIDEYEDQTVEIRTAAAVQISLLTMQLASLLFYLPIFLVARKSGANVGIKRETTIARNIALLVLTNLFFFTIPLVLGIFTPMVWDVHVESIAESNSWQGYDIESYQWYFASQETLPILCVTINAILNPFILAVRHPKIKQKIGVITGRCAAAVNRFVGFLRQSLHRCHNSVENEHENGIEMSHTDET